MTTIPPYPIYLSSSIANGPLNARLRQYLPQDRFELVLPQEFTPDVPHPTLPRAIYERCIEEMERSVAGLLVLDAFGVDCANEAGWYAARRKPFIGLAVANCKFLQHWMVKGSITSTISLDPLVCATIRKDAILKDCDNVLIDGWSGLADAVERLIPHPWRPHRFASHVARSPAASRSIRATNESPAAADS